MCGFAGYKLFDAPSEHNHNIVNAMSQSIAHRGPDDHGSWVSQDKTIVLTARRLSIIDLSPAGKQPMMDAQQTLVIVFNGEIYNYRELRKILEEHGHIFSSQTDTQVVLYAYKQWGIQCLEKLDGMFAFSMYDRRSEEIYLVRDRMGIKPLYFSMQGNALNFASEIKALWHLPWMEKRFSARSVYHYLTYLAVPAPMTIFEGVYKLPAGYYAKLDMHNQISFTQWYDVIGNSVADKSVHKKSFYVKTIREMLRASVKKRLVADVPVGSFLSGGLDSSLITALMAEQKKDIKTFNVSFEHDPNDERMWARKIARKFGTDHHELILSESQAFSFFQKMIYHQDEPLGDPTCIPLYFVSALARDAGVKVVLVGEGADELFCGYSFYVDYLKLHSYWDITQKYVPHFAKQGMFYAALPLYGNKNRKDLLRTWADERPLFWGGVRVFSELWKKDIFGGHLESSYDPIIEKMYPSFPQHGNSYDLLDYHRNRFNSKSSGDFFTQMTYLELKHRLPELILTRTDKMSMAASIEARVPFLDYRLVESVVNIPMQWKYKDNQTKYILKKAAEGIVPHEIIYRKKIGFSSPTNQWYAAKKSLFSNAVQDLVHSNGQLADMLNSDKIDNLINDNQKGLANYAPQLWAIQNLLGLERI